MEHGGKRAGAGRPKGSTKKGTQIDEFNMMLRAQKYSEEMLYILVDLAHFGTSESTRLTAATQVLDRAHGRPGQMKIPEPDDGSKDLANAMLDFISSPYMNRDAPLVNKGKLDTSPNKLDTSHVRKSILDD